MEGKYTAIASGALGIDKIDYDNLPTNSNGLKVADGIANGVQLEVFDTLTGKITDYCEAYKGFWFVR